MANYRGVELAPHTLESLVTWDVSGHAQRERDRMTLPIGHLRQCRAVTDGRRGALTRLALVSSLRGNLDEAAFMPADSRRSARIIDRFFAHIVGAAVVDLLVRTLVDPERQHQPAAGLRAWRPTILSL